MLYLVKNQTELLTCATEPHYFDALRRELEGTEVISEVEYHKRTALPVGVDAVATGDVEFL
jgi:hypothetical protein